ncbi:uncharacterized protein N7503_004244 [Penicillium pulvis]|uniref:uncharacterized protein n=1 Tax=Penicillium pulvis TaxID=1562058 RepID=UPI002548A0B9|nr:uncharacterized protein N7503_004244 [Penicillium pulvis]KAJ5806642.1 hypothetical protein N7503_004244 [Penicillium pulvis]
MAVTAFPSLGDSPDLTLLNAARLFTRLEHNLLSPGTELRTLRGSEFQRMRVTKNIEYARTLLSQLERSLPQLKSPDRRHEAQEELVRDRQLLKRMQAVLDEEETRANENNESEDVDAEWDELFAKPLAETSTKGESQDEPIYIKSEEKIIEPATTSVPLSTAAPPTATAPPALRNRLNQKPLSTTDSAKASGSSTHKNEKEQALSTHRLEQEDLTSSLVSLASQLKASSQSFQATLENEKSVLDRAVTGMDKTSATMEAAGKRMGMLRKMSEGKGWWGENDALCVDFWVMGCCDFDCLCFAQV